MEEDVGWFNSIAHSSSPSSTIPSLIPAYLYANSVQSYTTNSSSHPLVRTLHNSSVRSMRFYGEGIWQHPSMDEKKDNANPSVKPISTAENNFRASMVGPVFTETSDGEPDWVEFYPTHIDNFDQLPVSRSSIIMDIRNDPLSVKSLSSNQNPVTHTVSGETTTTTTYDQPHGVRWYEHPKPDEFTILNGIMISKLPSSAYDRIETILNQDTKTSGSITEPPKPSPPSDKNIENKWGWRGENIGSTTENSPSSSTSTINNVFVTSSMIVGTPSSSSLPTKEEVERIAELLPKEAYDDALRADQQDTHVAINDLRTIEKEWEGGLPSPQDKSATASLLPSKAEVQTIFSELPSESINDADRADAEAERNSYKYLSPSSSGTVLTPAEIREVRDRMPQEAFQDSVRDDAKAEKDKRLQSSLRSLDSSGIIDIGQTTIVESSGLLNGAGMRSRTFLQDTTNTSVIPDGIFASNQSSRLFGPANTHFAARDIFRQAISEDMSGGTIHNYGTIIEKYFKGKNNSNVSTDSETDPDVSFTTNTVTNIRSESGNGSILSGFTDAAVETANQRVPINRPSTSFLQEAIDDENEEEWTEVREALHPTNIRPSSLSPKDAFISVLPPSMKNDNNDINSDLNEIARIAEQSIQSRSMKGTTFIDPDAEDFEVNLPSSSSILPVSVRSMYNENEARYAAGGITDIENEPNQVYPPTDFHADAQKPTAHRKPQMEIGGTGVSPAASGAHSRSYHSKPSTYHFTDTSDTIAAALEPSLAEPTVTVAISTFTPLSVSDMLNNSINASVTDKGYEESDNLLVKEVLANEESKIAGERLVSAYRNAVKILVPPFTDEINHSNTPTDSKSMVSHTGPLPHGHGLQSIHTSLPSTTVPVIDPSSGLHTNEFGTGNSIIGTGKVSPMNGLTTSPIKIPHRHQSSSSSSVNPSNDSKTSPVRGSLTDPATKSIKPPEPVWLSMEQIFIDEYKQRNGNLHNEYKLRRNQLEQELMELVSMDPGFFPDKEYSSPSELLREMKAYRDAMEVNLQHRRSKVIPSSSSSKSSSSEPSIPSDLSGINSKQRERIMQKQKEIQALDAEHYASSLTKVEPVNRNSNANSSSSSSLPSSKNSLPSSRMYSTTNVTYGRKGHAGKDKEWATKHLTMDSNEHSTMVTPDFDHNYAPEIDEDVAEEDIIIPESIFSMSSSDTQVNYGPALTNMEEVPMIPMQPSTVQEFQFRTHPSYAKKSPQFPLIDSKEGMNGNEEVTLLETGTVSMVDHGPAVSDYDGSNRPLSNSA